LDVFDPFVVNECHLNSSAIAASSASLRQNMRSNISNGAAHQPSIFPEEDSVALAYLNLH
jgi:hypothetical protein